MLLRSQPELLPQAICAISFRSCPLPRCRGGSQRKGFACCKNGDRFESGVHPPEATLHRKPAQLTRLERAVLWTINSIRRGFVHFAAGTPGVKQTSLEVTETLRALLARLPVLQEKRCQSCEKTCSDDHPLQHDAGGKDLRRWRTKWREQHYQRRLANANAALRDRHDRRDFGKWPREEPNTQRQTESASDAQESSEQYIGALHGSSQHPAKNQPPGMPRYRADRVAKLREPAPDSNGAAPQERPAQCHNEAA